MKENTVASTVLQFLSILTYVNSKAIFVYTLYSRHFANCSNIGTAVWPTYLQNTNKCFPAPSLYQIEKYEKLIFAEQGVTDSGNLLWLTLAIAQLLVFLMQILLYIQNVVIFLNYLLCISLGIFVGCLIFFYSSYII